MQTAIDKNRLYLQRMGIQLPWPEAPAVVRQAAEPSAGAAPHRRRPIDAQPSHHETQAAPPAADPAITAALSPPDRLPPFSLLALRRSDGLILLDTVPGQQTQWPAVRQRLALDLLAAWSGHHGAVSWQQALYWPKPLSPEDAREMALGSLLGQHRQQPLQAILCLGDILQRSLAPDAGEELLLSRPLPDLPLRCLLLPHHPETLDASARRRLWCLLGNLPPDRA